ncbi:MAG: hypothetical protein MI862_29500, partial [Desulfobacterales bacterium]|nr:hypothetical protein [Desulfobacterales bacterium]
MIELLKELVATSNEWVEFRYHKRVHTEIAIQNGELSKANLKTLAGVGIRVLVEGSWGFFSTSNLSKEGLAQALEESIKAARMGAKFRKNKIEHLAIGDIAKGSYHYLPDLKDPDLKEKITTLLEMDKAIREDSELVVASEVAHNKLDDYKI